MNGDALAEFVGSLDDIERRELAAVIRAGRSSQQTARRRNGSTYDPRPANTVLAALEASSGGCRHRQDSGQDEAGLVTVSEVLERTRVPRRTITQWAKTGGVRGKKIGTMWIVHPDDITERLSRR